MTMKNLFKKKIILVILAVMVAVSVSLSFVWWGAEVAAPDADMGLSVTIGSGGETDTTVEVTVINNETGGALIPYWVTPETVDDVQVLLLTAGVSWLVEDDTERRELGKLTVTCDRIAILDGGAVVRDLTHAMGVDQSGTPVELFMISFSFTGTFFREDEEPLSDGECYLASNAGQVGVKIEVRMNNIDPAASNPNPYATIAGQTLNLRLTFSVEPLNVAVGARG
jgi:hypothetical protein